MEEGRECRRLQYLQRGFRTPRDRYRLGTLLRRELTLLLMMRGRLLVRDLAIQLRLLLRIGIINHGRVSICVVVLSMDRVLTFPSSYDEYTPMLYERLY
jgi:hypothetical protein